MFHVHRIADLELPELAPYRTLKLSPELRARGMFVAEGDKVVHRLLTSSLEVISVLVPDHRLPEYEPALSARSENVRVYIVTEKRVLTELVGFEMFQGVLAVAHVPKEPIIADLIAGTPAPRLFVAADGLSNAENVGALVRNCAAFGVQAVIFGETSASPYLRRAVRNSLGTVFHMPIIESRALAGAIRDLQEHGVHCIAAHPQPNSLPLAQADFSSDCCLVFGNEGQGISENVLAASDTTVAIPMSPAVDSLNVASSGAVFLYEVQRQRRTLFRPNA